APLKFNAKLDVEPRPGNAPGGRTAAKLKLDGTIAGIDVNLDGSGAGEISDPAAAAIHIGGRPDAPGGGALAGLVGLDAFANADPRPARVTFVADGAAKRAFRVDGKFASTDLNASAAGTVTLSGEGALDVAFRAASTKLPRRAGSAAVPADLRPHLAIEGHEGAVTDLAGKIAGTPVKGGVRLGLGEPLRGNGRIATDEVDAGELFAIITGAPPPSPGGRSTEWVAEPFGQPIAPAMEGRIEFRTANAQWMAG